MTWRRQVWHVFRKDLRVFWPWYAGVAIVTAANAWMSSPVGPQIESVSRMWPGMLLMYAIGSMVMMVLRADLAASPTEFWSTLPLSPTAVATAKLATVGTMLVMTTLAFITSAVAWALGTGEMLAALPRLACFVIAISTIGLAFGLTSTERRGFSVIGVLVMQLYLWASVIDDGDTPVVSSITHAVHAVPAILWLPAVALVVWTFLQVYRSREAPWRLYALVACASTAPALMLGRKERLDEPASQAPLANVLSARALWNPASEDRLEIAITTSDAERGRMRVLEDGVVLVEMRDGSSARLSIGTQQLERTSGFEPAVIPSSGAPVVIGMPQRRTDSTRYTPFYVRTFDTGVHNVARFTVEGRLVDYDVREVDRFPARPAAALRRDGRVLASERHRARGDTAGPRIELAARWLMTAERRESPWPLPAGLKAWNLGFALLSPDNGIEIPLRHSGYPGFASRNGVPGLVSADQHWTLHPATWSVARPPVTDAWLDSASVIVGAPVFHSAVRVRAVAEITPP